MSNIEALIQNYERFITPSWSRSVAGPERVMFAVYDPRDERRLRLRLGEFELATHRAQRGWALCDLTTAFGEWMSTKKYRDSYFEDPSSLSITLNTFEAFVRDKVVSRLSGDDVDHDTVVAIHGVASLFGFTRVSRLVELVEDDVKGRLLVLFPGQYDGNSYRLLDARDGWSYHAVPITAQG